VSDFVATAISIATNEVLAVFPLEGFSFNRPINTAGRAQISIEINDPRFSRLGMNVALNTEPASTALVVTYLDTPVFGGFIKTQMYTRSSGRLEITANSWSDYFNSRFQAEDYAYTWMAPADPMAIITRIVGDACSVSQSALNYQSSNTYDFGVPFNVVQQGTTGLSFWITASYPSIQLQMVSMILSTLVQMGYLVGFDYADEVAVDTSVQSGVSAVWKIANPYIGKTPAESNLTLDLGTAIDVVATKDGSGGKFGNKIVEMSTAAGSIMVYNSWPQSINKYGIWEVLEMHPDVNSTPNVQLTLDAMSASDLALAAYLQPKLQVTLPVNDPYLPLNSWNPGDAVLVKYSGSDGPIYGADPFLPAGYARWWRIIDARVTVPSHGVATQELTLNIVPSQTPEESGL